MISDLFKVILEANEERTALKGLYLLLRLFGNILDKP